MPYPRKIRKKKCKICQGQGALERSRILACPECTGRGWIEPSKGDERICSTCEGDGQIIVNEEAPCEHCLGKGYQIRIIELVPIEYTCHACEGTGLLDGEEKIGVVSCPDCEGTGSDPSFKECAVCAGTGAIDGWQCSNCQGNGVVHGIYSDDTDRDIACPKCNGNGEVSAILKCKRCQGIGHTTRNRIRDITPTN